MEDTPSSDPYEVALAETPPEAKAIALTQPVESALAFFDLNTLGEAISQSGFTAREAIDLLVSIMRDGECKAGEQIAAWREFKATLREAARLSGHIQEQTHVAGMALPGPSGLPGEAGATRLQIVEHTVRVAQQSQSVTERMLAESSFHRQLAISEPEDPTEEPQNAPPQKVTVVDATELPSDAGLYTCSSTPGKDQD